MARISTAHIYSQANSNATKAREKEVASGEKAATLKEIVRPSQAPGKWVHAKNLEDSLASKNAIAKNAAIANHILAASENALSQVQNFIQKAHELVISVVGSGTPDEATRQAGLSEAEGLFESVLASLNTRFGDRALMAGFKTDGLAFTPDGKFLGDDGKIEIEIEKGLKVPVNISTEESILGRVPGMENKEPLKNSESTDSKETIDSTELEEGEGKIKKSPGIDIPDTFTRLIKGLKENDMKMTQGTIQDFLSGIDQISLARGQIGSRMNEIDRALASHALESVQTSDAIAQVQESDAIKAYSDLARDQSILKAALSTAQKILHEVPSDVLFR